MPTSRFIPRYKIVADLLRKRILHGDYALKPIPSERRLAEELGVNYMTVRQSFQVLQEEDLIVRQANGRLRVKVARQGKTEHLNFAYLTPTLASPVLESWRANIERVAVSLSCNVRPVLYMHWDDPILLDALEGFDGVFLVPVPEPMPDSIAERLRKREHPVVVIDHDFSSYGIPSILSFPAVFVQKLLDHLESLGHTKIGCLNTQPTSARSEKGANIPPNGQILNRIDQWLYWMAAHGFVGRLEDHPVPAHGNAIEHAYKVMQKVLAEPTQVETAWFCTTTPAALGAMRAMLDRNIMPGRDIAVCTVNGEGMAGMVYPTLTALEPMDPTPFINLSLQWMMRGTQDWQGSLLMQPSEVPLVIRESTQPGVGKERTATPAASASARRKMASQAS